MVATAQYVFRGHLTQGFAELRTVVGGSGPNFNSIAIRPCYRNARHRTWYSALLPGHYTSPPVHTAQRVCTTASSSAE